ncbi:ester cyclase [Aldersonia sp. NBC_00410]|uniref:ester cyclase n=1 Tax=Aldersonia sp. NBC_00410 TaxID=2975954 RepID=UPI00225865BA|nr:ester cyclase [Aldersonia sp. NBC_00410]MCX5044393.1 ester cyclase [Aldersonia sp. NBC_00410]
MPDAIERAIALWAGGPPAGTGAEETFRTAYTDPVLINGTPTTAAELVARARSTHAALADLEFEIVERIDDGAKSAVVFRQSGRHIGTFPGDDPVPPSGATVTGIGIDVFTVENDRIAQIWVVSELLARLVR